MPLYFIDPPNGHAYGFPKPFDGDLDGLDLNAWLKAKGYPLEEISQFPGEVPCRVLQREE